MLKDGRHQCQTRQPENSEENVTVPSQVVIETALRKMIGSMGVKGGGLKDEKGCHLKNVDKFMNKSNRACGKKMKSATIQDQKKLFIT
jgi:hypothetical protein